MIASFQLGDALLAILELFFLIVFFWLLITVFADLFRDHSLSGWAKAAWILFVVILPFLGILVYFIARGSGMQERAIAEQKHAQEAFNTYVQDQAAKASPAEELEKISKLHDAGKLSDEEFNSLKAKIVSK
jgi:ABC-type transport system involved in cytochrome bd biosynthesis fused ATPase/permease subunit